MMPMNEEEMKKMIEEMSKYADMPKPIRITARYDEMLQKITGRAEDSVYMGEGSAFIYLLQNIFMEHPEIEKQYPPGALTFSINDVPPKTYSPLFDGDVVIFGVLR